MYGYELVSAHKGCKLAEEETLYLVGCREVENYEYLILIFVNRGI